MYADDIVVLSQSREDAQCQMDILSDWCLRWGMKANIKKSQVVHHRRRQKPRCKHPIKLLGQDMEYVEDYKYLGCWVNEKGNNNKTVVALTAAAGRSYGRIVGLFKKLGDMGCYTFNTLYHSYILPVANYAAAVWGFNDYPAAKVLKNRISRYYLGVHRFTPNAAVSIEMDLMDLQQTRWIEIMRYYNRVQNLEPDRLPKIVLVWDKSTGGKQWLGDVKKIAHILHLPDPENGVVYDLDAVQSAAAKYCKDRWWREAATKPKLRSYIQIRNPHDEF